MSFQPMNRRFDVNLDAIGEAVQSVFFPLDEPNWQGLNGRLYDFDLPWDHQDSKDADRSTENPVDGGSTPEGNVGEVEAGIGIANIAMLGLLALVGVLLFRKIF